MDCLTQKNSPNNELLEVSSAMSLKVESGGSVNRMNLASGDEVSEDPRMAMHGPGGLDTVDAVAASKRTDGIQ